MIISRDTEKEVEEIRKYIVAHKDTGAIDGIVASQNTGNNKSWTGHQADQRAIGGNIQIFGTPDQVVEKCIALKKAGVDGIQVSFFDFANDIEYFGANILPRLKQAGLRL
jgi:FMNH2-dependent dimethyl sulfone monooxygenase